MSRWCGSTRPVRLHGRGSETLFGAADAAKRFAWRARACPRPAWNKNAEVVHQLLLPCRRTAANRRKNGPPTPRGRKRPLRWDGTPSLSATLGERFTENRQLHRRLRHRLPRDRRRSVGRHAADDGAANGYGRPAPPRQTSTPLPTGQKIFKVRGLDSPIAQAVVLGHSRTGMLGMGTRHGLPRQALRHCAPTERLRTQSRPRISFHISSVACRFSERTPRLGATVCRHGGKPPI